ncbi:MAG: hydrolase 2, exosortase A system-associated [Methylovulum sp.]|nr:hydrolase 2, exosortase A system-associated [Methylovulum sp.]
MNPSYLGVTLTPFFIQGTQGKLFCLFAPPKSPQTEVLVFLPSFGEELNRCRVMVAMQARMLAELGMGCLLLDYYGTGDSEGDFGETRWEQWSQDAQTACGWLEAQGYQKQSLWGLRLGAIVAAELAAASPGRFQRLLLWQPVLEGKTLFTQFLRIRLAMLMDRGEAKETTQQMREVLQGGQPLEVAGYEINPQLAQAIDSKTLATIKLPENLRVDWFEAVMDGQTGAGVASDKVLAHWRQQGVNPTVHTFTGAAFWQLHERELAPDLLAKTTHLFR